MTCTPSKQILWICLLQLGHFHVAGWILSYWPKWRSSRLASRAGRNDTKLEELLCKGYSCRAIFGQDTCRKWKTPGKNTEKHLTSKKGKSLKLINILLLFKWRNHVFFFSHKGFQKTKLNNNCLPQVLATVWGATLCGGGKNHITGEIELIVCFTDGGGGD